MARPRKIRFPTAFPSDIRPPSGRSPPAPVSPPWRINCFDLLARHFIRFRKRLPARRFAPMDTDRRSTGMRAYVRAQVDDDTAVFNMIARLAIDLGHKKFLKRPGSVRPPANRTTHALDDPAKDPTACRGEAGRAGLRGRSRRTRIAESSPMYFRQCRT